MLERCLTFNRDSKSFHRSQLFSEFVSLGRDPVFRLHGPTPSFKPGLNLLLVERRNALSLLTMFRHKGTAFSESLEKFFPNWYQADVPLY